MGVLALIAEFENDIRRERQLDGIKKARERGTRFGRKPLLIAETIKQIRKLRKGRKDSARDHAADVPVEGIGVTEPCLLSQRNPHVSAGHIGLFRRAVFATSLFGFLA